MGRVSKLCLIFDREKVCGGLNTVGALSQEVQLRSQGLKLSLCRPFRR
jgi:hypothetical protein